MRGYPPGRYEIIADKFRVDRCTIPDYFTEEFWHNLRIWNISRVRGLPHGGGWASESTLLVQLFEIFDAAKALMQKAKVEEKNATMPTARRK
jgi:hypothetical protein